MQIAKPVLDVQLRAFAGWSLERPVIGNGHAGCGRGALEKGRYGTSPASYLIYKQAAERLGDNRALLSVMRKLLKRSYHTLRELGDEALAPV
jgi:uncharacterized membrane-anchored protein